MMIVIAILLSLLMLAVCWLDATRFTIPNWLVGLILALYPVYVLLNPESIEWIGALGIGVLAFAVGFALFAANVMGGGDVKLLAVTGLWVGMKSILSYLLLMSLLGGALALLLLAGRPAASYLWLRLCSERPLPRLLERGAPIPYGLAIAGALLILLAQGKITGIEGIL